MGRHLITTVAIRNTEDLLTMCMSADMIGPITNNLTNTPINAPNDLHWNAQGHTVLAI